MYYSVRQKKSDIAYFIARLFATLDLMFVVSVEVLAILLHWDRPNFPASSCELAILYVHVCLYSHSLACSLSSL